jgi:hypothetical protein
MNYLGFPWLSDDQILNMFSYFEKIGDLRKKWVFINSINTNLVVSKYFRAKSSGREIIDREKLCGLVFHDTSLLRDTIENGIVFFGIHGPYIELDPVVKQITLESFSKEGVHWSLLVYCSWTKNFYHYDSDPKSMNQKTAKMVTAVFSTIFDYDFGYFYPLKKRKLQFGGWECGYYIIISAEFILRIKGEFDPIELFDAINQPHYYKIQKCIKILSLLQKK